MLRELQLHALSKKEEYKMHDDDEEDEIEEDKANNLNRFWIKLNTKTASKTPLAKPICEILLVNRSFPRKVVRSATVVSLIHLTHRNTISGSGSVERAKRSESWYFFCSSNSPDAKEYPALANSTQRGSNKNL